MVNPLSYIRQHPKICKQLIDLSLTQLEQLISKADALHKKNQQEATSNLDDEQLNRHIFRRIFFSNSGIILIKLDIKNPI
jgi:hypothetical protein